ncbi:Tar ligand binding domain-containing protein [Herbaspirillum sp. C9C3]|uniref:Tar ligand binding domain-containing protein n=1 Tax=Herbaspirillum sp. C9C3 TaxID=2735271 RepID=UPI001584C30B|nr:Tar ligand binding domain-containing protein [Herbaspirillum sp. C9C3]NUT61397.1 hypothetical protein [Herbaspirillum sp. C9C3]
MMLRSISRRLTLLVALLSSLLLLVGVIGLAGVHQANDSLKRVYEQRTVPMWKLAEIQRLMQRTWLIISIGRNIRTPEFTAVYLKDAEESLSSVDRLLAEYFSTPLPPEEAALAEEFRSDLQRFREAGFIPALTALKSADYDAIRKIELDVMIPLSARYRTHLHTLARLQLDSANAEYEKALARFNILWQISLLSMGAGLVFAAGLGGLLVRGIVRSGQQFEQSQKAKGELERQLQQSQKVQALGQLTGGIAHDFNNMLTAILGYANLALERHVVDKHSKLGRYLAEIIASSERARDLVRRLLIFARSEPSDEARLIAVDDVVREACSMLSQSIPSSIELQISIEDAEPIKMDPGELNQVLVNLIINARDAIEGQGRIDMILHRVEITNQVCALAQQRFSGMYLALEVRDTGRGILSQHMSRLFDPFFTTKDIGKGTGLGLSMVHGIMSRIGGHVLVRSTPGKGSCFQLLFPFGNTSPGASSGGSLSR